MTSNLGAVRYAPHTYPHPGPGSASLARPARQDDPSRAHLTTEREEFPATTSNMAPSTGSPRRMCAVTVALSEPMDASPELDWAATIAAVLRLTYRNTTVEVIDSWRVDA